MYHWAVQLFRTSTLAWRRRVSSSTSERASKCFFWLSFWWQTTDSYNNLKSGLDQFGCPCHHIVVLVIVAAILMSERRYMWVLKKILHMFLPLSAYLLRHRDHLAIRPSEIRVNVIGRWAVFYLFQARFWWERVGLILTITRAEAEEQRLRCIHFVYIY